MKQSTVVAGFSCRESDHLTSSRQPGASKDRHGKWEVFRCGEIRRGYPSKRRKKTMPRPRTWPVRQAERLTDGSRLWIYVDMLDAGHGAPRKLLNEAPQQRVTDEHRLYVAVGEEWRAFHSDVFLPGTAPRPPLVDLGEAERVGNVADLRHEQRSGLVRHIQGITQISQRKHRIKCIVQDEEVNVFVHRHFGAVKYCPGQGVEHIAAINASIQLAEDVCIDLLDVF
jgi:hypothetical protein